MALKSMTGYGRGEASAGGIKIEVGLSSVNRKQFDVRVSLPRTLVALESRVYELIHGAVSRGSVTGTVEISVSGNARRKCVSIDTDMARAYIRGLSKAAAELGLKNDLTARSLVYLPQVVQYESLPEDLEKVWSLVRRALNAAVGKLVEMRKTEGAVLEEDLSRRFEKLKRHLDQIKTLAPKVTQKYRKVLKQRLKEAGLRRAVAATASAKPLAKPGTAAQAGVEFPGGPDDQQLMREVVLFADRSDISEEIVRLDSHFRQVSTLMGSRSPVGRALDFLCQEMFREINTIGSKANDAAISGLVIQFKAVLESIREQVQNLE